MEKPREASVKMFNTQQCKDLTKAFMRFHPDAMLCTDQKTSDACKVGKCLVNNVDS